MLWGSVTRLARSSLAWRQTSMILDLNEPAFVPFNSAARQIVYAESGRAVETVFVEWASRGPRWQARHCRRGEFGRRSGGTRTRPSVATPVI